MDRSLLIRQLNIDSRHAHCYRLAFTHQIILTSDDFFGHERETIRCHGHDCLAFLFPFLRAVQQ